MLPQAGVEPAFSRLEVGRDIHFATKVLYMRVYIFKLQCSFSFIFTDFARLFVTFFTNFFTTF